MSATTDAAAWLLLGKPALPVSTLPALVQSGNYFALADGSPFTLIEATDFELLHWFLDGRDIRPVLQQRHDCGYNCVRVWTCYDFNGPLGWWILLPAQRPEVYTRLGEFAGLCAAYGLYIELVAYTNVADLAHWDKLGRAILDGKATNCLVEWRNEHAVVNGGCPMNPDAFAPLPGVLCSHGSAGEHGAQSVRPWWQYETAHYNDAYEWPRKVGHNTMELSRGAEGLPASHVPAIANENTRYPDNCQNTRWAYDAAAGAALLCAGSCFHSVSGKKSEPWQAGVELDAANAWAAGARSVDLRCQRGPYVHRQDLETPDVLRAYEQPTEGASCVVLIHR